ncbi:MAG: winged helix-turn-helix domain-containing protein [Burkholderiales bacterium]
MFIVVRGRAAALDLGLPGARSTRTLDSHACRLRAKLGGHGERYVVNVWGVGYRLVDAPPVAARPDERLTA